MRAGFPGEMADGVDVAGAVVGEGLRPTPGVVVFGRAAESTPGVELRIEEPDAPLDPAAKSLEPLSSDGGVLELPVGAALSPYLDSLPGELDSHLLSGPVRVVAEEGTLERSLEELVEPLDVVAVAGYLDHEGDSALGGED